MIACHCRLRVDDGYNTAGARTLMPLWDWLRRIEQQNLGRKNLGRQKTMQSRIFLALLLTFVLAQEEPETKELFGSRRKINLVNNVLHSTVRKILRPYRNKIPRTFTKNTRVYHGNQTFCHFSSNSIKSSADDSMIFVFKNVYCTRVSFLLQCTAKERT